MDGGGLKPTLLEECVVCHLDAELKGQLPKASMLEVAGIAEWAKLKNFFYQVTECH
jgi:hypothetical protein